MCGVTSRDGIQKNWSRASRQKAAASGDFSGKTFAHRILSHATSEDDVQR